MINNNFKIGLDFHGVIDTIDLSFLSESIIKNEGEVHIITGGSWTEELENQIKEYGVKWTHFFSVYDYLMKSNIETIGEFSFPDGTIQERFPSNIWDKVKGDYCYKNNISIHIDDTKPYGDFFKTPFCLFNNKKNKK